MSSEARYDLLSALAAIPPDVHYEEFINVGAALHYEGYGIDVWRDWVRGCVQPDHSHRLDEVDKHWRSFGENTGAPVTGGTLVKYARDHGWTPEQGETRRTGRPLDFDAVIGGHADEPAIVDGACVGDYDEEVRPMFGDGREVEEFTSYLTALFEPSDIIGYVCDYESEEKDGITRCKPGSRGAFTRTMGEVRDAVLKSGLEDGLGYTLHDESGAWIRFNPLDGQGVGNANVAAYRFALLESDDMPQGKFAAIVKQLNLPVAAMVDSGNKSLHAIVRIDATDAKQYRERVDVLYARCEKNGIAVDKANKNASRLSRMPGVTRNGKRQFLASLSQGASDWEEWEEWYAEATDELPDAMPLDTMLGDNLPPLKPALIEGMLRIGHKMLVSGPSKAGKSFALIALCIALAEGREWFGMKCRRSRVMYVNLELDGDSCINRFNDMYNALGIEPAHAGDIDVWNLRGKSEPMHKLLPKLVRRCLKRDVEVVVLDPIYKVVTGDENSAGDMAQFANLFDALCEQAGVSAIYCHHHSKGFQGGKRSIDRASGSGVFGRDPDAILDMVELETDNGMTWKRVQDKCCALCADTVADAGGEDAWGELPEVARNIERNAIDNACAMLDEKTANELRAECDKVKASQDALTAWRIEGTLREFPHMKPINAWFDWPLHIVDESLAECKELGDEEARPRGKGKKKPDTRKEKPDDEQARAYAEINAAIEKAVRYCDEDDVPATRENVRVRIPDVAGKPPTKRQILDWTRKDKTWSEWCMGERIEGDESGAKVIVRKA